MKAQTAFDTLRPDQWAQTLVQDRLRILRQIQRNMVRHGDDLAAADGRMKNELIGQDTYAAGVSLYLTGGVIGGAVAATIDVYESISKGQPMTGKNITELADGTFDIEVYPRTTKDRITAGRQRGHLRVKGQPRQLNPFDKPAGVVAVLGAGNYSASIETIKALFWENKAVIHKPHSLNTASDAVWQQIFAPLVDIGALAFADADQGHELTQLAGLTAIYFTGGTETAKAIMAATDTPLVAECGGNNPCIIVPGDRPWTAKEIAHQAQQFVTLSKMNGGAVCGRAQTLVTSKHWPQREQFLAAVRSAFTADTPAVSTYYPGSDEARKRFAREYPDAEVLSAEDGIYATSDGLFITGAAPDSFAAQHEAFCQVIAEIPLDVPAGADHFLPKPLSTATMACSAPSPA